MSSISFAINAVTLATLAFAIVFAILALVPLCNADVGKPSLFIEKNISQSKFSWTDTEMITITITNEGNLAAKEILVVDHIPAGFVAIANNFTINEDTVSTNLSDLNAGEERTISYSVTGKQGMNGNVQIPLQPAEVTYKDSAGNEYDKKSNHVEIVVESANWQENLAATTLFLVVLSFGFGYFGSVIHRATSDSSGNGKSNNKPVWKNAFLGGAAGIVVLGTFQGLSTLFSGGQLQPSAQNIIVLLSTCLASGFAPNAVIDKITQQWKNKADQATAEKNKAIEEKQNKANQAEDVSASNDSNVSEIDTMRQKLLDLNDEIQSLKLENERLKRHKK